MKGDVDMVIKELKEGLDLGKKFYDEFPKVFSDSGVNLNLAAEALGSHFNKPIFKKNANFSKIGKGISGFTKVEEDGAYIFVNSAEPPARQRFTVAHELGHIYGEDIKLDEIGELNIVYRSDLESFYDAPIKVKNEQRANAFASEILMPEHQVLKYLQAGMNVEEMAVIFGVSPQAMKIRIASVIHAQYQN